MKKGRCKVCKVVQLVLQHHIQYKKYGAEKDKTISLCVPCHNFLHRFVKGSDKDLALVTQEFIKGGKFWK